jgi:hypothetical protein
LRLCEEIRLLSRRWGSSSGAEWPAGRAWTARSRFAISGVSGVIGRNEGTFACAGYQGVAEPGFQVVVELTQRVQLV